MITYCFIINYHLLFIIKIAEAVSINKTKNLNKTNIAFPPKIAREFLFALARLASCKTNNNLARQS